MKSPHTLGLIAIDRSKRIPELTVSTDQAVETLERLEGWRRADLLRYMAFMAGTPPPIELLDHEGRLGASADIRASALFTLDAWHGRAGLASFVAALRDRSPEVSLLAATAVARYGTSDESDEFIRWVKRRFSRRNRVSNYDKHELPAAILFASRAKNVDEVAALLRRYRGNLAAEELQLLHERGAGLLTGTEPVAVEAIDVPGIVAWGDEQGEVLSGSRSTPLADHHHEKVRELLAWRPRPR